jgi:hypothetical protein
VPRSIEAFKSLRVGGTLLMKDPNFMSALTTYRTLNNIIAEDPMQDSPNLGTISDAKFRFRNAHENM